MNNLSYKSKEHLGDAIYTLVVREYLVYNEKYRIGLDVLFSNEFMCKLAKDLNLPTLEPNGTLKEHKTRADGYSKIYANAFEVYIYDMYAISGLDSIRDYFLTKILPSFIKYYPVKAIFYKLCKDEEEANSYLNFNINEQDCNLVQDNIG